MSLRNDKRMYIGLGIAIAIVIFCTIYYFFCGQEVSEKWRETSGPPQPFTLAVAESTRIPIWYYAVGAISSKHKAIVSAQISGVVSSFDAELGDFASQGVQIVQIRAEELEARKARVVSQLLGAEVQKKLALSHFERIQELYKESAVTLEQFEQAEQRLSDMTALVAETSEMLREAEINLSYGSVETPFEGLITERFVDPGDFVWPGRQLFSIYDPTAGQIEVTIPERYIDKLSIGLEANVEVEALGKVLKARVSEIRPHVDPKTRAFVTKCDFIEEEELLYPGMFGTLVFQTGEREAVLIPSEAVLTLGQLNFVWVQVSSEWQKRYVTIGREFEGRRVEVLSGLSSYERIAVIEKARSE